MPTYNDNIVRNMTYLGATNPKTWITNPKKGGQLGLGSNAPNLDASAPLLLIPVTPVVIHLPTMYDDNVDMQIFMKTMVECHSKSITNISPNYQADFDDVLIGHDGQSLSVPKGVKRSPVSPNITYQDVIGAGIWFGHRTWLTDTRDPDTGFSFIGMNNDLALVPSVWSMATLFIQHDPTGRPDNILNAWVIGCMFPEETGEFGSEKNIGESKTMERSIGYKGILFESKPILEMAKEIATEMQLHTIKYFNDSKPINAGVDGYIQSSYKNSGVAKEIEDYLA